MHLLLQDRTGHFGTIENMDTTNLDKTGQNLDKFGQILTIFVQNGDIFSYTWYEEYILEPSQVLRVLFLSHKSMFQHPQNDLEPKPPSSLLQTQMLTPTPTQKCHDQFLFIHV